jgi:hypothetical protein
VRNVRLEDIDPALVEELAGIVIGMEDYSSLTA